METALGAFVQKFPDGTLNLSGLPGGQIVILPILAEDPQSVDDEGHQFHQVTMLSNSLSLSLSLSTYDTGVWFAFFWGFFPLFFPFLFPPCSFRFPTSTFFLFCSVCPFF